MNTFATRSLPVHFSVAKLFNFRWQYTQIVTEYKKRYICHGLTTDMNKALNLTEEQSEDGWRPVMGRFCVAEAGIGCRGTLQAKHRASRKRLQVGIGHIRMLGEVQLPSPRKAICL